MPFRGCRQSKVDHHCNSKHGYSIATTLGKGDMAGVEVRNQVATITNDRSNLATGKGIAVWCNLQPRAIALHLPVDLSTTRIGKSDCLV